jgi:hypothetical protein
MPRTFTKMNFVTEKECTGALKTVLFAGENKRKPKKETVYEATLISSSPIRCQSCPWYNKTSPINKQNHSQHHIKICV